MWQPWACAFPISNFRGIGQLSQQLCSESVTTFTPSHWLSTAVVLRKVSSWEKRDSADSWFKLQNSPLALLKLLWNCTAFYCFFLPKLPSFPLSSNMGRPASWSNCSPRCRQLPSYFPLRRVSPIISYIFNPILVSTYERTSANTPKRTGS